MFFGFFLDIVFGFFLFVLGFFGFFLIFLVLGEVEGFLRPTRGRFIGLPLRFRAPAWGAR